MKKTNQIQNEIKELLAVNTQKMKKGEVRKLNNEINNLKLLAIYLETNPTEEYILKEIEKKRKELMSIKDGFMEWLWNTPEAMRLKNPKAKYNQLFEVSKIKKHISNLEHLL